MYIVTKSVLQKETMCIFALMCRQNGNGAIQLVTDTKIATRKKKYSEKNSFKCVFSLKCHPARCGDVHVPTFVRLKYVVTLEIVSAVTHATYSNTRIIFTVTGSRWQTDNSLSYRLRLENRIGITFSSNFVGRSMLHRRTSTHCCEFRFAFAQNKNSEY